MRSGVVRRLLLVAALGIAVAPAAALPARATLAPGIVAAAQRTTGGDDSATAPVVAACANPKLPGEILEGPVPASEAPLPVVDAGVARATLRLAVADDVVERERGLMCVTRLRPRHGMLFVFPENAEWEFWMKNTLVPLDMIWLEADGTVTAIAARVPASTQAAPERSIARRHGRGSLVIELRGGEAALDRIAVGSHVDLPPLRAAR